MTNGCICCTLREDLLAEVRRLSEMGRFDDLIIELTDIAEPLPVAATFDFRDAEGASLGDVARLDTMATVVDAANLLADFGSRDLLRDRGQRRDEGDERTLVELLVRSSLVDNWDRSAGVPAEWGFLRCWPLVGAPECSHVCDTMTQLRLGRIVAYVRHAHRHDPQPQVTASVSAA